jgi:hypothetical protein
MLHPSVRLPSSLLIVALAWLVGLPASADTLVVPAALENVEGNMANAGPFGKFLALNNDPFRTQQVYAASAFSAIGDVIGIHQLRFRSDGSEGSSGPSTSNDIEIRLSTTQKDVDGLDFTDLDLNVDGADVTLVYAGSLTLQSCNCGTPTRDFDLVVDLQTPFYYDPSAGNLLFEVINTSDPYPLAFFLDAQDVAGDATSRLVEVIDASQAHMILGQNVSLGLVTQFVYTVPEPSSAWAGVVAAFGLLALRRAA